MTEKKKLRAQIRTQISQLPAHYNKQASREICRKVLTHPAYLRANTIFCFVGTKNEIDTALILEQTLKSGKKLYVPYCEKGGTMTARRMQSFDVLKSGAFGILTPPKESETIEPKEIDCCIVPCLSADAAGNRLGQGGGYYDKFLPALRENAVTILLCRHPLLQEEIMTQPHDIACDILVTEQQVFGEKA